MGFYPVDPVGGVYEVGAPLFEEVKLHLANGNTFTVLCNPEHSENGIRPLKAFLNGNELEGTTITHRDIMNGGILKFK